MASAVRKTLLVTASTDNTVRVWDYSKCTCVTCFQGQYPPLVVAMHPWGAEMIIGYKGHTHVYTIANELIEGVRLHSPGGGASIALYSPHGNLLAVACEKVVQV
jgi:WD40 repeat protein